MTFSTRLYKRNGQEQLNLPDIQIVPLRWGSMAAGGPEYAILECYGPEGALWQMVDDGGWLRFGVEIYNDNRQPVWWGYVESATLSTELVSVSVSLEEMFNSVAVEYGEGNTGFSENAASIAEYGRKQKTISVGSELAGSVSQRQSTELFYTASPRPVQDIRRSDRAMVTLRCVGWLKTLAWLYYSQADGLTEYVGTGSTDQIFGAGVTDNEFWFVAESREIHDTGMNLYKFERGQRVAVSGSSSNNTVYTVARATTSGPAGLTISGQLNFVAGTGSEPIHTIYRYGSTAPGELAWIAPGDRIHITNTSSNNGWYRVTGVSSSWANMFITVAESLTNEVAAGPVLWRGHAIGLEEQPTEEKPGATVTITVDGSKVAQQFVPATSWNCATIAVKLRKIGTPSDGVQLSLRTDSAGSPAWPPVATVTVAAASISTNSTWVEFTFSSAQALTGGTVYWFVLERTGSVDPSNYYAVALDEDAGYGGGILRLWNGASWVARTVDADVLFRAIGTQETTGQISDIIDNINGAGQFLDGATVEDASGVYTNQYRAGIADALTELTELLEIGTSNGRRLLCAVQQDKSVRVWEEDAYSGDPDYIRRLDGTISTWQGVPLQAGELISGVWLQVEIPQPPAKSVNVNPALLFVERCEYDAASLTYTITPRGAPNIWRLAVTPKQG